MKKARWIIYLAFFFAVILRRFTVGGQVQVPCIERNAIAAVKAINASRMALRLTTQPRVTLDKVIETMYETGKDMNAKYRETSTGGLAIKILPCD